MLVDEEVGAVRLAHAVSRLVGTTVRAAKADLTAATGGEGNGQLEVLLEVLGGVGHDDGS